MTFAELKTETFRRLEESASTPVFWTVAEVETALNEAYLEMSDESEWYERWTTVSLLHDRPYYDLRTVLPRPALKVGAAFNTQTSRWLIPSRVTDLARGDRRWMIRTGDAERLFTKGLWWLAYWPKAAADAGTIKQYYTALPDVLVADTDEPGFPVQFHLGIVDGALTDLWAQDGETALALHAWQAYLAYESALTGFVNGRGGVPMVHGATDDVAVTA